MEPTRRVPATAAALLLLVAAGVGRAQLYETAPGWSATVSYGQLGASVDGGIDENGDGFDDVLVSAPFYLASGCCPSSNQEGAARIYFGSPTGPGPVLQEVGASSGATLGAHIRAAGDIDGDGFDDVLFSAGSGFGGGTHRVHARFGSPSGTFSQSWTYDSGLLLGSLGPPIDGGGDVNGDGHTDVIAGWWRELSDRGRVRVFLGSPTGLPAVPDLTLTGPAAGARLGLAVAFVGDVDSDGFDDALICRSGAYDLHRGTAFGLQPNASATLTPGPNAACTTDRPFDGAGDVNGDGFDDVVIGGSVTSTAGEVRIYFGSASGLSNAAVQILAGDAYFGYAVAGLGDVNGDGFAGVGVGMPLFIGDPSDSGSVFVHLGSPGGLQTIAAWQNDPIAGLTSIGRSLASAGDVNDDGFDDLLVGAEGQNEVFVYFGAPSLVGGDAGSFPSDGSSRLELRRGPGGSVELSWGPSCAGPLEDYVVYIGPIGDWSAAMPVTCSTDGSTSWAFGDDGSDRFLLVAPRSLDREGSLGEATHGPRPQPALRCLTRSALACP